MAQVYFANKAHSYFWEKGSSIDQIALLSESPTWQGGTQAGSVDGLGWGWRSIPMATVIKPRRGSVVAPYARNQPLTAEEIALVRDTLLPVAKIGDQAGAQFYGRLFELDPELESLFENTDMAVQGRKLMVTVGLAVDALDRLGEIIPSLSELGVKHAAYGVRPEHYEAAGTALIDTLKGALTDDCSPAAEAAWIKTYNLLTTTMAAADNSSAAAN